MNRGSALLIGSHKDMVLRLLDKKSMTARELTDDISERQGWMGEHNPNDIMSLCCIAPTLLGMTREGLIKRIPVPATVSNLKYKGPKKVFQYSITPKGKRALNVALNYMIQVNKYFPIGM